MRRLLTEKLARSVTTEKTQEDVRDTAVEGFVLRVTRAGSRTWCLVYRVPGTGQRRRAVLGRYPAMNAEEAREMVRAKLALLQEGHDPQRVASVSRVGGPTFGDLAAQYLERYARAKERRSADRQEHEIRTKLLPRWGQRRARSITRADVLDLLDGLPARGARGGKIGANRLLALVRVIFGWAERRDLVERNPATGVDPPGQERRRERVLSPDELRVFWRACEADGTPLAFAYRVQLLTLQRIHEVLRLRWEDIRGDWWVIPAAYVKGGHEHHVYLTPLVRELLGGVPRPSWRATLQRRRNGEVWVFPAARSGRFPHLTVPRKGLLRVRGAADWWGHDLRRTAHTALGERGVSRLTRELLVGHAPQDVGRHYDLYSYRPEMRAAWELWSDHVAGLVGLGGGAGGLAVDGALAGDLRQNPGVDLVLDPAGVSE